MSTPPRYHRDPPHAELDWADLKARLAFSHGAETVALIGAGRHPPTEADLQAWRALGRSEPKMDVEDMPSAEAVARAVVASAAILGEDPLSIAGGGVVQGEAAGAQGAEGLLPRLFVGPPRPPCRHSRHGAAAGPVSSALGLVARAGRGGLPRRVRSA